MQRAANVCLPFVIAAVIAVPAPARADGYVTPWIGLSVSDITDNGHTAFGVTTGYMGAGVFGFEADVGYSPDLSGPSSLFRSDTSITAMGDFILGIPIGGTHGAGVRPFVTGGLGVVRMHSEVGDLVEVSRTANTLNYNLGFGMMGFFSHHFGLRGDVRYFRTLEDTDRFSGFDLEPARLRYWRVTSGVTFR